MIVSFQCSETPIRPRLLFLSLSLDFCPLYNKSPPGEFICRRSTKAALSPPSVISGTATVVSLSFTFVSIGTGSICLKGNSVTEGSVRCNLRHSHIQEETRGWAVNRARDVAGAVVSAHHKY